MIKKHKIKKSEQWRRTKEYRVWRIKVIRRDKRCVICGSIKSRNAHHMNHATYFPNERFDVKNGVCLCRKCHTQFHTNFKRSFRQKCTKYDFNNFTCLVDYFKDTFSTYNFKSKIILDKKGTK